MTTIHRACGAPYGSRRIRAALQQQGLRVGRRRVRRLMRQAGIVPQRTKTPRRGTTRRNPQAMAAPNRLQQQFVADAPHTCWVGDITADLVIKHDGQRSVVQAKRQQAAISVSAIQDGVAAKRCYRCRGAMVITNSTVTKAA